MFSSHPLLYIGKAASVQVKRDNAYPSFLQSQLYELPINAFDVICRVTPIVQGGYGAFQDAFCFKVSIFISFVPRKAQDKLQRPSAGVWDNQSIYSSVH
jgi:hypothetical protein